MFCDIFDLCFQHAVTVWPAFGGFPFSVYVVINIVMSQNTSVFEQRFGIVKGNLLDITGTVKYVYAEATLLSV
jgi:hypothetical protein